jgi:hypothetical protein
MKKTIFENEEERIRKKLEDKIVATMTKGQKRRAAYKEREQGLSEN